MLIPWSWASGLTGALPEGVTATDLVLTVRRCCASRAWSGVCRVLRRGPCRPDAGRPRDHRQHGPEYGATCGFFPIDAEDARLSAPVVRGDQIALVGAYASATGFWIRRPIRSSRPLPDAGADLLLDVVPACGPQTPAGCACCCRTCRSISPRTWPTGRPQTAHRSVDRRCSRPKAAPHMGQKPGGRPPEDPASRDQGGRTRRWRW